MTTVVLDQSMSLDGYTTAANQTAAVPLGDSGQVLVDWAFGDDPTNREFMANAIGGLGAVIAGRQTYDHSVPWWEANGPSGIARRPVFVVTHEAPAESPEGGVYEFVTGGIEEALERAAKAAGDGAVVVMGGANLGQQFLEAGLLDEISIHLVPVLLGGGTRLFENMTLDLTNLEPVEVLHTPVVTHLRYRLVRE